MKKIAPFLIILSGVVWGTMGVFVKEMEKLGFNSYDITALRVSVAAIAFTITVLATDKSRFKITIKDIGLFVTTGVGCVLSMSFLYLYTISNTSLSVAAILLYTSPIWVIVISSVFLKEKFTWQKLVSLLCAFVGCILVSYTGGNNGSIGVLFFISGLGAGLTYALYSIFGTVALRKYHSYTVTMYSFIFAALVSWIVIGPRGTIEVIQNYPDKLQLFVIIILNGLITAYIPYMLYTIGLKNTVPGKAAIMACSEPLTASILGVVLYGQKVSISGIVLIIFAIMIVNDFGILKGR